MFRKILPVLIAVSVSPLSALAAPPALVRMAPSFVFIPAGFDNNDQTEVVITGEMPSTCYKVGPSRARIDRVGKQVLVQATAYVYNDQPCLDVMVPYSQTISIGMLPEAGTYQVLAEAGNGSVRPAGLLAVAQSPASRVDSLEYASITDTHLISGGALAIEGRLLNSCMFLKEVRTLYRSPRVIEVLPIIEMRRGPGCVPAYRPFHTRVAVHPNGPGQNLIHVRSMNGQAINLVTEF